MDVEGFPKDRPVLFYGSAGVSRCQWVWHPGANPVRVIGDPAAERWAPSLVNRLGSGRLNIKQLGLSHCQWVWHAGANPVRVIGDPAAERWAQVESDPSLVNRLGSRRLNIDQLGFGSDYIVRGLLMPPAPPALKLEKA
ncbi:unnamed protein product [Heligmosomoides polygyrus]|uniref:Hydrolase n=1 Tax=Heligmosomoides polygyrus TaxID=6339 RepID=A0A183FWH1_HELPZ|nr:unnamed protein product [Heligmosomoides polygyrus]